MVFSIERDKRAECFASLLLSLWLFVVVVVAAAAGAVVVRSFLCQLLAIQEYRAPIVFTKMTG